MADPITEAQQKCSTRRHNRLGDALGCLELLTQSPGKSHHVEEHTQRYCTDVSFTCGRIDTYVVVEGPGPICPSLQFIAKQNPRAEDHDVFIMRERTPNLAHPLFDAQACQAFLQRTTPEKHWRVCSSRTKDGAYVHTVEPTNTSPKTPCEMSCQVLLADPVWYSSALMCQGQGEEPYKVPSGGH